MVKITVEKLPDDRDLIIPVSVYLRGGEAEIVCAEPFESIAREYAKESDLLSGAALKRLFEKVDPVMRGMGYRMPEDSFELDYVGVLEVSPECGEHTTKIGKEALNTENLTDIDLAEAAEAHQESFVCEENGRIVSVAVENFADDDFVEIAAETAEPYRRRGYAYSACAALCRDIIEAGYAVRWQCEETNLTSVALAEKLGFRAIGRDMYMCYYLNGNGEN